MQATPGAPLSGDRGQPGATAPRRTLLICWVAGLALAADVITKTLAVEQLTGRDPVEVVPDVLSLTLTRNPGAAFSVGGELTVLLTLVACAVVCVVLRVATRVRSVGWAWALGLLLGGAVGNLVDRLLRAPGPFRGHVVDFLQLPHWPVFNLADSCIVVAACLIALLSLRGIGIDGRKVGQPDHQPVAEPTQEPGR